MSIPQRLHLHPRMRKPSRRGFLLSAAVAAASAWGIPAGALASGSTTSITLTAGALAFSTTPSASDFPSTSLTGSQQVVHTSFASWGVNDATGSGAGWHVTFQATRFTGASGARPTLPTGSLSLTAPVVGASGVNLATPPVLQCTPSCTLDSGSAVAIVHATAGTGQGGWTMTQSNLSGGDLALTVPASATADTYTSTLTFTLASGP